MKTKKIQSIIRVVLILGIIILVNFISIRIFGRIDLTKSKIYTLSDASKNLVSNLDDRVTIKAYFTEELPSPYNNNRRAVLDILNDYKAYSNGNFYFEFINPENEKTEEDAKQAGVPPVEVQVVKEDKFEVKKAYLGMVMLYEDRKEVLPIIQNLGSLEFDITSALKRLTNKNKKKIAFTDGHGESGPKTMSTVIQELSKQYEIVPLDFSGAKKEIPQDISVLLVVSPQKKLFDSTKYYFDQYLMKGGKIAFFLNKMQADLNAQVKMGLPLDIGLEDMVENYGVKINEDLVRDAKCQRIMVTQYHGQYQLQSQVPFPYIPISTITQKDNPITKDLQGVTFYFVSSLDTTGASSKGLKTEVLLQTSKHSGRESGYVMLNPMQRYTMEELSESGIPLAVKAKGVFNSLFINKNITPQVTKSPETEIIVVGDGDFMKDNYLAPGNLVFFVNIVDYLADDLGLSTIRSKNVAIPELDPIEDGTKKIYKILNITLPILLVVGYGIFRWRRRAIIKKYLENNL